MHSYTEIKKQLRKVLNLVLFLNCFKISMKFQTIVNFNSLNLYCTFLIYYEEFVSVL